MKEAILYEKLKGKDVKCNLCGHRCSLKPGSFGICGARKNIEGILNSVSYGRVIASNADPIEKKPLFHFLPGSLSLSVASAGCNFQCKFCQNYSISQLRNERILDSGEEVSAKEVVEAAAKQKSKSISYTYTEPTVNMEFVYDCSKLAKDRGISNVWVTNGYMTGEAIELIAPYIDAANVDLKAFDEKTYREVLGGKLEVVLDSIKALRERGVWLEVTTLVIPEMNDSDQELGKIADFIKSVDPFIPWHVSAYHADYKYATRRDRTPGKTLEKAAKIGYEHGVKYIYCGNIWGLEGEHTKCHNCGKLLIERYGFTIRNNKIKEGLCSGCQTKIPGIWK